MKDRQLPTVKQLAEQLGIARSTAQERLAGYRCGLIGREALFAPPRENTTAFARRLGLPSAEEIAEKVGIGVTAAQKRLRKFRAGRITIEQLTERKEKARIRCGNKGFRFDAGNAEWQSLGNRSHPERLAAIPGTTVLERRYA